MARFRFPVIYQVDDHNRRIEVALIDRRSDVYRQPAACEQCRFSMRNKYATVTR